jgi:hypothetical protein
MQKEEKISVALYFIVMGLYLYGFYGFGNTIREMF